MKNDDGSLFTDDDLPEIYELVTRASTDAFFVWDPQTDEIARSENYLPSFGYNAADVQADTD